MNPFLATAVGALAVLTIWGFISPRGQWRVLAAWSRREPYANEPGPGVVAVIRIVAAAGIVVVVAAAWGGYRAYLDSLPTPPTPPGPVEQMWGSPAPQVVNRVFTPRRTAPDALVSQPIAGYQVVDGASRDPQYLFFLDHLTVSHADDGIGYLGHDPAPGLVALDTADLVVEVRGDRECIPQQVVVIEGKDTVSVGVYYGQPNPTDGSNAPNLVDCTVEPDASHARQVLIPIDLETKLGDRDVIAVDSGDKVPAVPYVD